MKKLIFILVAFFISTFTSAQITLVKTLPGAAFATANISIETNGVTPHYDYIESPYIYVGSRSSDQHSFTICLYDKQNFDLYKSFTINKTEDFWFMAWGCIVTKNLLTTDGKTCICISGWQDPQGYTCVYDEDGALVQTLQGICPHIFQIDEEYFLTTFDSWPTVQETYIYSLPGNGIASGIGSPAPQKSSLRKYLRNDKVFIESNDKTYTIQGQEVK